MEEKEGKKQIFVRLPTGRHRVLDVSPQDTIGEIQTIIQGLEGYPVQIQTMRFNGHYVYPEQSLQELKVPREGTLHISIRVHTPLPK